MVFSISRFLVSPNASNAKPVVQVCPRRSDTAFSLEKHAIDRDGVLVEEVHPPIIAAAEESPTDDVAKSGRNDT